MNRARVLFRLAVASVVALLLGGCQTVVFGIANRGVARPDATAVYDQPHALSLDIFRPRDAKADAPVIVFFYGGSWQRGNRAQYRFVGRRLTETGAVVMVADYRLAPKTPFPGFMYDGARAVAWARQHAADYGGDPKRLFIAGHSAGAQIAALLGTDARYLKTVGLEPKQLAGVIGLSGPYNFTIAGDHDLERAFGPSAQWPDAMATRFVDGDEPPFLLAVGTNDKIVSPGQTYELDAHLKDAGVPVQTLRLPDGSHFTPLVELYSPKRGPQLLETIGAFVRRP
ncbi:Acetyl esterase/lipase [Pseudoxanthomonas sp. GM95]|uniref:alpha/beta hydrolase n=1 Tax=Pseudoxanthomonas sp. GM95 TaxID=1881043 RepID=UPI0008BB3F31|nr:alpha/beta hydrolase [Pseudoxanthomonas sp. GM95]SEK59012.1 Acetyl esterase/lipase [Pseudoxanthomonas sp. GM95]